MEPTATSLDGSVEVGPGVRGKSPGGPATRGSPDQRPQLDEERKKHAQRRRQPCKGPEASRSQVYWKNHGNLS